MILNEKQIEEIESRLGNYWSHEPIKNLLETVKALRKENDEQRELLEATQDYIMHTPVCKSGIGCDCGFTELQKQIEEHLK